MYPVGAELSTSREFLVANFDIPVWLIAALPVALRTISLYADDDQEERAIVPKEVVPA